MLSSLYVVRPQLDLEYIAEEEWQGKQACMRPLAMMTMYNPMYKP